VYDDFTLDALKQQFGLRTDERRGRFSHVLPSDISAWLRETLDQNLPLALAISTEKARSELLVMPVLLEAYRQTGQGFSLFSGVEFNVDIEAGLRGFCDFLLSLSPEQFFVEAPVVAVVEAKNDNIKSGLGQCAAEMLAAQTFNERRANPIPSVFGAVTTGSLWMFLRLTAELVSIDRTEYHIAQVERTVGVLSAMVRGAQPVS
jgi:hypothetical protein